MASNHGPSPSLAQDVESLIGDGFADKHKVKSSFGHWVYRFALTPAGRERFGRSEKKTGDMLIN